MSMLLAAALSLSLSAAAAPSGDRQIKLASPGLGSVNLKKDRADFFANHFAQVLGERGIRVITAQEVNAVLGLARTQQLMGCDESATDCMTELADALGVDGVITGSIGQFGPTYQANLNVVSNGDGKLLGSATVRADSEQQMLEALAVAAKQVASEVGAALGKPARRYVNQALFTDAYALLLEGDINLQYARALGPRWSLLAAFGLGLNRTTEELPGIGATEAKIVGELRYHFFDSPPFGLYLGGGLGFFTGYAFGITPAGQAVAFGTSAFSLVVEVGYSIALFDFLHLSVGLGGALGVAHQGLVLSTGEVLDRIVGVPGGDLTTGIGFAF